MGATEEVDHLEERLGWHASGRDVGHGWGGSSWGIWGVNMVRVAATLDCTERRQRVRLKLWETPVYLLTGEQVLAISSMILVHPN